MASLGALLAEDAAAEAQQAAQKNAPKSSEELLEVHCGSRQDSIDRISGNTLQPIAL